MNQIVPFQFETQEIRAIERDGDPWFVLVDVCKILGHTNPTVAASRLDDDEKAALNISDTALNNVAQQRLVNIISESGLYSLILTSRLPDARRFKKWVTSEVLPAIRKTGRYQIDRPKTTGEMLVENAKAFREIEIRQIEQAEQIGKIATAVENFGAHEDFKSIKAYAAIIGRKITTKESGEFGRQATALSKQQGQKIGRQPDEAFGFVNTYHREILTWIFGEAA